VANYDDLDRWRREEEEGVKSPQIPFLRQLVPKGVVWMGKEANTKFSLGRECQILCLFATMFNQHQQPPQIHIVIR
jgi:hypothetical protein